MPLTDLQFLGLVVALALVPCVGLAIAVLLARGPRTRRG